MSGGVNSIPPPVTPQPERLPLNDPNFSWEQFEAFCRDFIASLPDVVECNHYGKKGNKQRGIDLVATLSDGSRWVFQCKQHKKFTAEQVRRAVSDTTYAANRYHLLLACEAGVDVRDEIDNHANWESWDVRDVSRKVRTLPADTARRLIETHFDVMWRNKFLGLPAEGAFVTADQFFAPLINTSNLFNHSWSLVGREHYTQELHRFASSDGARVVLLTGRGGIGKSKILHAFSGDFQTTHPGKALRFVVEGVPLTADSVDALPNSPGIILVDDAHRREDLQHLLALARRRRQPTKLVLAIRPGARERILSLITMGGYDARETLVLDELKDLSREDVKKLAGQALGNPDSPHVSALAAATADSPLITLIGGRLLAEQAVDPRLLERHDEFRRDVLTRFQDVLVGQVADRIDPGLSKEILRLLAGISPYRTENSDLEQRTADFLGLGLHELREALGALEEAGVLLRRGYTLRITPDVLADHILHGACLTGQGRTTGYADRLFEQFADVCPAGLLSNLAELDWRINQATGQETDLLQEIWRSIHAEFASASNRERYHLLDVLREVAYHQPTQTLQLVEFALRNPAPDEGGGGSRFLASTNERVRSKLPELLRRIGYTLDYLPRCCDLLWELGRDDQRQTGPNPEHAIRVLEDFAEYDIGKPVSMNLALIKAADRWLAAPDAHEHAHSPLQILDKLLQKSGHSTYSEEHRFVSRPFLVNRENTQQLRDEALRLIMGCARAGALAVRLRAINSLAVALQDPIAYYTMVISEETLREWEPEHLRVLALLEELIAEDNHPLVHLRIMKAVDWHARRHKLESVRNRAREVESAIPETPALRLIRVLTNGYSWLSNLGEDAQAASERHDLTATNERQQAAEEFVRDHPSAEEGAQYLNSLLTEISVATGAQPQPWLFLIQLANNSPEYAADMCDAIVKEPDRLLAYHLVNLLPHVNQADPSRAFGVAQRIVDSQHPVLCLSLAAASGFWAARWQGEVPQTDLDLLNRLSTIGGSQLKVSLISLFPLLWASGKRQEAVEMACSLDIEGDVGLLDWLCAIFRDAQNGIHPDSLSDEDIQRLLNKIGSAVSISEWSIGTFLVYAAKRLPRQVVQMLLNRCAADRIEVGHFEPLPPLGLDQELEGLKLSDEYHDLLRLVRDRVLQAVKPLEARWSIPQLFKEVSLRFSQPSLEVLNEWVESGDHHKVEAVGLLLKDAGSHFVFGEEAFIVNLLNKAYSLGDECYAQVWDSLLSIAMFGTRHGISGQPFPEDVSLRDRSSATATRYPVGSPPHRFYDTLRKGAEASIKDQLARDEELSA